MRLSSGVYMVADRICRRHVRQRLESSSNQSDTSSLPTSNYIRKSCFLRHTFVSRGHRNTRSLQVRCDTTLVVLQGHA